MVFWMDASDRKRLYEYERKLDRLLNTTPKSFEDIKMIEDTGVYAISRKGIKKPIYYIGETGRGVKVRMTELTSDYRSHTLNRKVLLEILKDEWKWEIGKMKKKEIYEKVERLNDKAKQRLQDKVNKRINNRFEVRFIPITENKKSIRSFEHFAIAIEKPELND